MKLRTTLTALVITFLLTSVNAQLLPIKNTLQTDLAAVIGDYPNGFKNLAGEITRNNPQSVEFDCKTSVKGAISCQVVKYSSTTKDIYSWEAEMLRTDDFEEAAKKFRSIYNSLQNLSVNINGTHVVFKGDYTKPSESIKFTTIVFNGGEKAADLNRLKVSLMLESDMLDWVIKIQVYEKEKEDDERGKIID